jgi:hypothetical protein
VLSVKGCVAVTSTVSGDQSFVSIDTAIAGGSLTPWTSNINAANFTLDSVQGIGVNIPAQLGTASVYINQGAANLLPLFIFANGRTQSPLSTQNGADQPGIFPGSWAGCTQCKFQFAHDVLYGWD